MTLPLHSLEYKGVLITCLAGVYRLSCEPGRMYFSMNDCKKKIDSLPENQQDPNVSTIYKPKSRK